MGGGPLGTKVSFSGPAVHFLGPYIYYSRGYVEELGLGPK